MSDTLADKNAKEFDDFVAANTNGLAIENEYTGLYMRTLATSRENETELRHLMERLTGSFQFEAEQKFIDNGLAFLITLPRIVIDFD